MNKCLAYDDGRDMCWMKNGEADHSCGSDPGHCLLAPRVLPLTLKREWFDMILSGEKKEEYREIKPHFQSRLCGSYLSEANGCRKSNCQNCGWWSRGRKDLDAIEFRNGYSKDAPTMLVECKGITTGIGNPEWGAPSHPVFIIKLGGIIETKNINHPRA